MLEIKADITEAATLSGDVYASEHYYSRIKEAVLARAWHYVTDVDNVRVAGSIWPFTVLEGSLDEPLILTRDFDDQLHCFSNVCTHRANLVCEHPTNARQLQCRYHGRRFKLDGKFMGMPEFDEVKNFPSAADDLPQVALQNLGNKFLFVNIHNPFCTFEDWIQPILTKVGFLPFQNFKFESSLSRHYIIKANWMLYCDNYLEGFHIPFVHQSLNAALDYGSYRVELYEWCNLQVGIAKGHDHKFDLPTGHPDFGQNIAAYYFWMFPNLMLNFYPWGLSMNLVQPLGYDRTKVSFLPFIWKPELMEQGAGGYSGLDRVEREDEAVVESAQKGVKSRLYKSGRYSVKREQCVHHFHRLIAQSLASFTK